MPALFETIVSESRPSNVCLSSSCFRELLWNSIAIKREIGVENTYVEVPLRRCRYSELGLKLERSDRAV